MTLRGTLFLCSLLGTLPALALESVRIAMSEEAPQTVQITGEALAFGEDAEEPLFRPLNRDVVRVTLGRSGLELDGAPIVGDAVRLHASGHPHDAGEVRKPSLEVLGRRVHGDVVVLKTGERLNVVNVLPLEEYVVAVLGAEMPPDFPLEALKAQAVAVRTYALQRKLAAYGKPWHLGSTVLHQVYRGANFEDVRSRSAAEATRGEILTFELAPIEAYFHASCGGHTEKGRDALSRDLPYLADVDCPCRERGPTRWSLHVSGAELAALGGEAMRIAARSSTGRARSVRVGERLFDAAEFRQRLGYQRLKSLAFEVAPSGRSGVTLEGKGWGHGAGLCQWGARALAERSWDYRRILAHYYPGTELQPLY